MKSLTSFAAASNQFTTHGVLVVKLDFEGASGIGSGMYVQVHDSATTPADGVAPLRAFPLDDAGAGFQTFDLSRGDLSIGKGLYICVSSTEATKTLSANTWAKMTVELEMPEKPAEVTYAGDLTTNVQTLLVWTDAAGPKHLTEVEVDGSGVGTDSYLQLFASLPTNGDVPIKQWLILASTAYTKANSKAFSFGPYGVNVSSFAAYSSTLRDGCYLAISTTQGVLTTTASNYKIKAGYIA